MLSIFDKGLIHKELLYIGEQEGLTKMPHVPFENTRQLKLTIVGLRSMPKFKKKKGKSNPISRCQWMLEQRISIWNNETEKRNPWNLTSVPWLLSFQDSQRVSLAFLKRQVIYKQLEDLPVLSTTSSTGQKPQNIPPLCFCNS